MNSMFSLPLMISAILKNYKIRIAALFACCAILAICWSVQLDKEWGTDYGNYYVGSSLISNEYRLYEDHFDHKGPVFYAFLKLIGKIIGWGPVQAIECLAIIVMLFLFSVWLITYSQKRDFSTTLLFVFLASMTLIKQDTNASISIFQTSLLLFMVYFIDKAKSSNNNHLYLHFFIASIFWSLAILTRIDALPYIFVFPCIFFSIKTFKINKVIISIIVPLLIFFIILLILCPLLHYTLESFWRCNWQFNLKYKALSAYSSKLGYIYRPESFFLFMNTGIAVFYAVIITQARLNISNWKNILFDKKTLLIIILISFLIYFLTGSDKDYHLLILQPAFIAFAFLFPSPSRHAKLALLAIMLVILTYGNFRSIRAFHGAIKHKNVFYMKDKNDKEIVEILRNNPKIVAIYVRAWHFLFAQKTPVIGLMPYPVFYEPYHVFPKENYNLEMKWKKEICSQGTYVLVEKDIIDYPTLLAKDLFKRSSIVKVIGRTQLRKVELECR